MYRIAITIAAIIALSVPAMAEPPIADTSWVLTSIHGIPVNAKSALTLEFDSRGKLSGTGSCGKFTGLTATGFGNLTFRSMAITETDCPNHLVQVGFYDIIPYISAYNINGDILELQNAEREVLAEFTSAD